MSDKRPEHDPPTAPRQSAAPDAAATGATAAGAGAGDLAAVADHVRITRLQAAYADVVNRRAWSELVALFEPDAKVRIDPVTRDPIDVVGPVALGSFIGDAVERFAFFEFVLLNAHVVLPTAAEPDLAGARIFMCEVRRDVDTLEWSVAYGVYHDRYRRSATGWRFAGRDYQSLTRTGSEVFPFPHGLAAAVPVTALDQSS